MQLILPLLQRTRVHEDLRTLLLHIIEDLASELWSIPPETNIVYSQVLLQVVTEVVRCFPSDDAQMKKASDGMVKTLSLLFKCLLAAVTMTVVSSNAEWDGCIVASYLKAIRSMTVRLTYYPLLMKTIFETTVMVLNNCIGGFDMQSMEDMNGLFEFMITALDRYK